MRAGEQHRVVRTARAGPLPLVRQSPQCERARNCTLFSPRVLPAVEVGSPPCERAGTGALFLSPSGSAVEVGVGVETQVPDARIPRALPARVRVGFSDFLRTRGWGSPSLWPTPAYPVPPPREWVGSFEKTRLPVRATEGTSRLPHWLHPTVSTRRHWRLSTYTPPSPKRVARCPSHPAFHQGTNGFRARIAGSHLLPGGRCRVAAMLAMLLGVRAVLAMQHGWHALSERA